MVFFATVFLALGFFAATFSGALTADFFAAAFFAVRFFATAGFATALAAWNAAQRFFVAADIARLPAALNFLLRFGASEVATDSDAPLDSAHRFRWASPMRFRAAALIFRRLPFGTVSVVAGLVRPPGILV